jgi:cytochrome P450
MRRVANELVDRFVDTGRVDIMAEFADPYPARIICELIGVPAEWHDRFRGWANDLGWRSPTPPRPTWSGSSPRSPG